MNKIVLNSQVLITYITYSIMTISIIVSASFNRESVCRYSKFGQTLPKFEVAYIIYIYGTAPKDVFICLY